MKKKVIATVSAAAIIIFLVSLIGTMIKNNIEKKEIEGTTFEIVDFMSFDKPPYFYDNFFYKHINVLSGKEYSTTRRQASVILFGQGVCQIVIKDSRPMIKNIEYPDNNFQIIAEVHNRKYGTELDGAYVEATLQRYVDDEGFSDPLSETYSEEDWDFFEWVSWSLGQQDIKAAFEEAK